MQGVAVNGWKLSDFMQPNADIKTKYVNLNKMDTSHTSNVSNTREKGTFGCKVSCAQKWQMSSFRATAQRIQLILAK